MATRQVFKASILLLAANLAAGVGHYFFQVRAAALLTAPEYGVLNAWMAYLGISLTAGSIAQIGANFLTLSARKLKQISLTSLALSLALTLITVIIPADHPAVPWAVGVLSFTLGVLFHFWVGQFQGRTWFIWMGSILFGLAVIKVGTTFAIPREQGFYWAFPFSYGLTCVLASLIAFFQSRSSVQATAHVTSSAKHQSWIATPILAFGMALIPQLDLLNLRFSQPDQVLGEFARASLFAKAIFFAALTLLQVTLPYHIQWRRHQISEAMHRKIRLFELAGLGLCVLGSPVLAYLAPIITSRFLGFELSRDQQTWVLLSCLSLTALYGQLQRIQMLCALGQWKPAALKILPLAATLPVFYLLQVDSVTRYLVFALGFYAILNLGDVVAARMRARPPRSR